MNRPTRTLAALTGAAALTVAGMSPASAGLWAGEDAVGDVVSYSYTWDNKGNETESGPDPRPANTDTDIARFSARHTPRRVVLRATLRDITADSGGLYYKIRTPGTRRPYYAVQRLGTSRASRDEWPAFALRRGNGDRVRCSGVGRSVDRTTEQAVVSIPRRCLGRPGWVRIGVAAVKSQWTETRTKSTSTTFVDDGLKNSFSFETWRLTLSPRIQRG
jgi:hypothetical protein